MKLDEIKPIFIVKLPPMGSAEDEKLSIGNYDEANLYYGDLACTEIKGYSENQMQEYAKAKVLEALKKYGVQAEEWSEHESDLAHKQMTKFIFDDEEK